jgi:Serine incorporator (Serinc)
LIFQWGLSRLIIDRVPSQIFLHDYWVEDCLERLQQEQPNNNNNDKMDASLQQEKDNDTFLYSCVGNQANYRVGMATLIFFGLAGLAALCKPTANREAWPAKYTLYLFLVVATMFLPSTFPLLHNDIFLHIARGTCACGCVLNRSMSVSVSNEEEEERLPCIVGVVLFVCGGKQK